MGNFKLIKSEAKKKGIKMVRLIEVSGLTSAGFYKAGRNDSFSPEVLHKIANELGIPVSKFEGLNDSVYLALLANASFNIINLYSYLANDLFNLQMKEFHSKEVVKERIEDYFRNGILDKFIPYVSDNNIIATYEAIKKEINKPKVKKKTK